MDFCDKAKGSEEKFRQQALDSQKQNRGQTAGASLEFCIECGDPIPSKRREKQPGCTMCVPCLQDIERGFK